MLNSFKKKIIAGFVLVTVICVVLLTSISLYDTNRALSSQMEKTGQAIAKIARNTVSESNVNDVNEISGIFRYIKEDGDGEIVYISLADKNTRILAHNDSSMVGTTAVKDEMFNKAFNGEIVGGFYERANGQLVYNVSMPFMMEIRL